MTHVWVRLFTSAVLCISLLAYGCKMLEKAVLKSKDGGNAWKKAAYNISRFYRNEFTLMESGDFRIEEAETGEKVLLLIHGFGSGSDIWGTKEDTESTLGIAHRVFRGRVLIANFPSKESIEKIAGGLSSELEKIKARRGGTLPNIVVFAHSIGGVVARSIVRTHPDYFEEVALVAAPNDGLRFGVLTKFIFENYAKYLDELLSRYGVPGEGNGGETGGWSIDDLRPGSAFLERIDSPTEPLDVIYHFFVFKRTTSNNPFIPGMDDSLISPKSAYPYPLMREGNFEAVRVGSVVCFRGDVNHHSLIFNPDIVRYILEILKEDSRPNTACGALPPRRVLTVQITEAHPYELKQRAKILQER